jgi:hypothetical protein
MLEAAVPKKKSQPDASVRRAAAILEEHFASLPKGEQKKARRELHKLATNVSGRARARMS